MGKPQVFDDQEQERVYERVAAVDVAKASGVVCLRLPHPAQPAGRRSYVWEVPATMGAVTELAGRLVAEGVQKVTLESASVIRGHRLASATGCGGPALPVPPSVAHGLSGDRLRHRQPTAALISRLPLVAAAFALPVADASVTA